MSEATLAQSAGDSQVADPRTLDDFAKEINARFEAAEKHDSKAEDYRISAGIMLNQAKALVLAEDKTKGSWEKWRAANVKRSKRDCNKVMRIAASPDPHAARKQEKSANSAAQRAKRAKRASGADVSPTSTSRKSRTDRRHEKDNAEAAFFIRAEQAEEFTKLKVPRRCVTNDMVIAARAVAKAWDSMARSLEEILQPGEQGGAQTPAPKPAASEVQTEKAAETTTTAASVPHTADAKRKITQPQVADQPAPNPSANIFDGDDDKIIASESYLLNAQPDPVAALDFARRTYRFKQNGEFPKEPTEWQMLCWNLPDNVRGLLVRRTIARAV